MSSISSRSLSMSSLIFLPFLASSGLGAAPSPPSAGLVGLTSFFFCSAISPSMGQRAVSQRPCRKVPETTTARILARPFSQASEVLAEGQGLPLVGRAQARTIDPLGARSKPLEQDFERGLAVVHHERYLA